MPHYQFPTNYVYWENIKEHDDLKAKYMPIINEIERRKDTPLKNPFNFCDINVTSFSEKNTFLSSNDIDKIIWKPLDNFIEEINSNYQCKIQVKNSVVYSYWFNTYKIGDFQEFHDHHGGRELINNEYHYPIFSGIYILNDDTKSSSIMFKTPSTLPVPFSDLSNSHYFYTNKESDIKEGSVVIFPSQLEHMVKKCIKSGRRTIAFNIYSQL
jgi:hypothetical protein